MTSETTVRDTVRRELSTYGLLHRVENRLLPAGMPDCAYTLRRRKKTFSGWIEYKYLAQWPSRPKTPVYLRKLTKAQILWLEAEHEIGGRAFLLLMVCRSTWLLLTAPVVRELYERRLTTARLIQQARVYSTEGFPRVEILETLTQEGHESDREDE